MEKKNGFFGFDKAMVKTTIDMAWPAMIESFFVSFTGLVDSFMVSRLGSDKVAAIGITNQPKFIGLCLFFALNVSLSALVARRKGEQKRDQANTIFVTAFVFMLIASTLISIAMVTFASPIMHLCKTEPNTHEDAVNYFRIIMGCMIFNCISMTINAAQRGSGNTKITMRTNVTSNVVNVIGNYLLIEGHLGFPALGVTGAAIATVFGTFVACLMSIFSIRKKNCFISIPYIIENKIRPAINAFFQIIHVGYSIFLEQLLMRVGFLLTSVMAADQGTSAMAAHQLGMHVMSLSFSFGDGLQATAVALIGQSLGAKRTEDAKTYGAICRRIGSMIAVVLAVVYFFGAPFFCGLFFPKDVVAVTEGVKILRIIIFVVIFQISQVIYMGCLRGAGDTAYTAMASTVCVTIIRTACSYFFAYVVGLGIAGIWFGVLSDQVGRFLFSSIRFKQGRWVQIKI